LEDDMTPQERQLINELFQRLASLENNPRDPDADAMIREGLRRAPNAPYSLVQTVLVQDEALKAANNRIQEYEQAYGAPQQQQEQPRGFLDNMRESVFGREEPRGGSVPRVPQGGAAMGTPWGQGAGPVPGYQNAPMQAPQQGGGGSFLGTAAAAAAGVIGGSLLMGGIRSALGGHQGGPASKAFEDIGGGDRSPWTGNASGSDLSREAGLNDIGGGRSASGDAGEGRRAGLFDSASNESGSDSDFDDSGHDGDTGFDSGDSEE
jgi:uncharacterized protein